MSNNDTHTIIGSLKSAVKQGFRSINHEHAVNACKSFKRHIQLVIDAEGSQKTVMTSIINNFEKFYFLCFCIY